MTKTRRRLVAVAVPAALLLAACGDSDGDDETEPQAESTDGAAEQWEPEYVDGVLQPLPDGFPDQPITVVIADEAGSAEGIQVRHTQEAAERLSPVPIELEARTDFTGIPTWEAVKYVADDAEGKEGYKVVAFAGIGSLADLIGTPVEDVTGLTIDDLQEVITNENTVWFVSQCADVAWGPSMEEMVAYSNENPGEVRYMGQSGVGGTDLGFFSYMEALDGGEVDVIPVGGAIEKTTAAAACEGDVTAATAETTLPHVDNGRLDILMISGDERLDAYPDVPTAVELGIENGLVSNKQYVTGPDVPPEHVAWLFELFKAIAEDPDYVAAREEFPGTQVFVRGPEDSDQRNRDDLEVIETVMTELGVVG